MKKFLSVFLAAIMMFTVMLPAFAANGDKFTATFTGPSANLLTKDPNGNDIGTPYIFIKTENGKMCFEEDENGLYYLANDGYYYTRDKLVDSSISPDAKTYSPVAYEPGTAYPLTEGETFSFTVQTNEAYNVATAVVYINGVAASKNALGEYTVYVDRSFSVYVNESVLERTQFNVILSSGDGYKVRTLNNENYKAVYYGDDFSFRVKILNGYSDAGLSVSVNRGATGLEALLGEDAALFDKIFGNNEALASDGVDAEGYRTYTIKCITTDCKVNVGGVKAAKTANILNIFKRVIKMLLDLLGIDSSFLGLDIFNFNYYTVNIDDSGLEGSDISYMLITGVDDEFVMDQFNVMGGDSVTIQFVTYDSSLIRLSDIYGDIGDAPEGYYEQKLKVTWDPGNANGAYNNVWKANLNKTNGKTYYTTTFIIDNINAATNVTIGVQ